MSRPRKHMARVASIGCILCKSQGINDSPAEVHHIREEQGVAMRASDWLTVPLCPEHHRGGSGLHGMGRKAFERVYKMSELDLLALTIEALHDR